MPLGVRERLEREFIDDVGCARKPGCSDGVDSCDIAPTCQVRVQIGDVPGYWKNSPEHLDENEYGMTWKRMEPAFMESSAYGVGCTAQKFEFEEAYELCYAEPKCIHILQVVRDDDDWALCADNAVDDYF